jgi:hypothetical protein
VVSVVSEVLEPWEANQALSKCQALLQLGHHNQLNRNHLLQVLQQELELRQILLQG